jgi:hypothetical protein
MSDAARSDLNRKALQLEYATIGWNIGEAALTIGLGIAAGSLALIGFGSDSIIEIFASLVVVWHLIPGHEYDHPARTALALRLVAAAFAVLAVVLVSLSIRDLVSGRRSVTSSAVGARRSLPGVLPTWQSPRWSCSPWPGRKVG